MGVQRQLLVLQYKTKCTSVTNQVVSSPTVYVFVSQKYHTTKMHQSIQQITRSCKVKKMQILTINLCLVPDRLSRRMPSQIQTVQQLSLPLTTALSEGMQQTQTYTSINFHFEMKKKFDSAIHHMFKK